MKIQTFLKKINYKVYSGEIYSGELLKDKLLYWIHFNDKYEKNKGKLLISSIDQKIYYIEYSRQDETYVYQDKIISNQQITNIISLKKMLSLLTK